MVQTIEAIYDGAVLRPEEPLSLEADTRVRLTLETLPNEEKPTLSFLETARSLDLDGPPNWSAQVDEYLNGDSD